ncbi:MAG: DegT/DnrJ/EryC1/StrS family aminotransferase [Pyrinomonadaceae bacterium]
MRQLEQNKLLERFRPSRVWKGEPGLGGWYTEAEIRAVTKAIRESMDWNTGFSARKEIEAFENAFAEYVGTRHAIAVNGAGTGLDVAIMCLDPQPDDEIISCALNFPGTHLAIIGQGAKLVLCEPDPQTLNINANDVEKRITPKTRAILATHMNGLSVNMDALLNIAERNPHSKYGPPKVIGDAARACGGTYKGTRIGKRGWMNVFSFQSKKLMSTLGEGGMITTDDTEVADKIRRFRSFGDGLSWGTNYKMTKVQAAVGMVQLRRLNRMNMKRIERAKQRTMLLEDIVDLTLPYEPIGYGHVYYFYTVLVPPTWGGAKRDQLIKIMEADYKIGCAIANPPTYQRNQLIRKHVRDQNLPIADTIGARLFCPALHPLMTEEENEYVAAAISAAVERIRQDS